MNTAAKAFLATTCVAIWLSLIGYSFTMPTPQMFVIVMFTTVAPLCLFLIYNFFYDVFK